MPKINMHTSLPPLDAPDSLKAEGGIVACGVVGQLALYVAGFMGVLLFIWRM